ncbi:hypothetical protein [Azospirillum sp. B4]|uniref:hypothetical protein n=1 Tax=Azospirillum sp. B4 TaxID=95605 RepID=UPI0011DDB98F|nr:hypothetical protein [Azospirillum sp. B4]
MMNNPKSLSIQVPGALVTRIDRWRGGQLDVPPRSEAIRRLTEMALDHEAAQAAKETEGR